MSKFLEQINEWQKKFHVSQDSYRKDGIHPERDWRIFLITTFIILFFSALISYYIYIQINQDKLFAIKEDSLPGNVEIDAELLKKIVDDINLRKANWKAIKQNQTIPSDPSL